MRLCRDVVRGQSLHFQRPQGASKANMTPQGPGFAVLCEERLATPFVPFSGPWANPQRTQFRALAGAERVENKSQSSMSIGDGPVQNVRRHTRDFSLAPWRLVRRGQAPGRPTGRERTVSDPKTVRSLSTTSVTPSVYWKSDCVTALGGGEF